MQQAKDNGWKFSPQNIEKIAEIKEKETAEIQEKKNQEQQKANTDITTSLLAGAAVAVAATSIANVVNPPVPAPAPLFTPQTKTVENVGGVFMLPDNKENMNPEYVAKVMDAGKKFLKQIKMPKSEISIATIKADTSLLPIQKRYAEAAALELRPDIKKDKLTEDTAIKTIAIQKSLARHQRKQAKRDGRPLPKQENKRPDWTKEEALVMKRVNRIKQSAGTVLSMDEIKEKLGHPALVRIYEARMRKDHPEFFAEQDKQAAKQAQIAKLRAVRRHYRQDTKKGLTATLAGAQEKPHQKSSKLGNSLKAFEEKPKKRKTLQTAIKARAVQNVRKKIA